jgi:hypothetical protein
MVVMNLSRSHIANVLRNAGLDAAYLIVGLPLGILSFTVAVTGLSLAAGFMITLIGIPLLLATLVLARWFAAVERRRAALLLGEPIPAGERPLGGSLWERTKTVVADGASWLDLLWSLLLLPLGVAGFSAVVTVWSTALGFLSSPLWTWALPEDDTNLAFFNDPSAGYSVLRMLTGLALVPVAYFVSRGLAVGTARLAQLTLGTRQSRTLPPESIAAIA